MTITDIIDRVLHPTRWKMERRLKATSIPRLYADDEYYAIVEPDAVYVVQKRGAA